MHFTCAARTDIGIVRSGNEDNYLMLADRGIFIVADGMGGHAAGEVASEMAVRITSHEIGSIRGLSDEQVGERVSAAIRSANDAIFERTLAEHDKRGMGTTATVLVLLPRRYLIGQVGDSRAYLLRKGELQQLTKDHSYVQEQVDAGLLTPEQARVHPYSNVITRCVGASMDVVPDIYFGSLEAGDVILLAKRRAHGDARGRAAHPDSERGGRTAALGGPHGHRGQPARRARQHHRDRDPDRFGGQHDRGAPGRHCRGGIDLRFKAASERMIGRIVMKERIVVSASSFARFASQRGADWLDPPSSAGGRVRWRAGASG